MNLAAAPFVEHFVETICPVDAHHTYHRQEDAHPDTGRPLQLEGIEVFHAHPRVTRFDKSEGINGGGGLQQYREVSMAAPHER